MVCVEGTRYTDGVCVGIITVFVVDIATGVTKATFNLLYASSVACVSRHVDIPNASGIPTFSGLLRPPSCP